MSRTSAPSSSLVSEFSALLDTFVASNNLPDVREGLQTLEVFVKNLSKSESALTDVRFQRIRLKNQNFEIRLGHLKYARSLLALIGYKPSMLAGVYLEFDPAGLIIDIKSRESLTLTALPSSRSAAAMFHPSPVPAVSEELSMESIEDAIARDLSGVSPTLSLMDSQDHFDDDDDDGAQASHAEHDAEQEFLRYKTDVLSLLSQIRSKIAAKLSEVNVEFESVVRRELDEKYQWRSVRLACIHDDIGNKRESMEDNHVLIDDFFRPGWGYFAVYDGHGGTEAVNFLTCCLHRNFEFYLRKLHGWMKYESEWYGSSGGSSSITSTQRGTAPKSAIQIADEMGIIGLSSMTMRPTFRSIRRPLSSVRIRERCRSAVYGSRPLPSSSSRTSRMIKQQQKKQSRMSSSLKKTSMIKSDAIGIAPDLLNNRSAKMIPSSKSMKLAFKDVFQMSDNQIQRAGIYQSGATATVVILSDSYAPPSSSLSSSFVFNPSSKSDPRTLLKPGMGRFQWRRRMFCGNIGDARCVLCRNGQAIRLSKDHKASDKSEKQRIRNMGFEVNHGRVCGIIGVSRAFGDHFLKPPVSNDPYFLDFEVFVRPTKRDSPLALRSTVKSIDAYLKDESTVMMVGSDKMKKKMIVGPSSLLSSKSKSKSKSQSTGMKKSLDQECVYDDFVVLCCDGVWDVMSDQECVDYIRNFILEKLGLSEWTDSVYRSEKWKSVALDAMKALVHHAIYELGSTDNVSAMLVVL